MEDGAPGDKEGIPSGEQPGKGGYPRGLGGASAHLRDSLVQAEAKKNEGGHLGSGRED